MAAEAQRQGRIPSASSLKRSGNGDTQLQLLSPEGSTVYMTEVKVHEMPTDSPWQVEHRDDYCHGNPITNKGTTLLGAPRKTDTVRSPSYNHPHPTAECTTTGTGLDAVTNHLSELSVTGGRGSAGAAEECDSSSESSSDSESAVLERAKVEGLDLQRLEAGPDGKAPLELVSQFVFCLMRDEYKAAKILCEKVMQLEPRNETVTQFYPLIQERIQLDNTLSTESSSSDDESTEVSDDSSSDHTHSSSSSSSESSSDSEGEIEQTAPLSSTTTTPAGAIGGGEKDQGSHMNNTHKQCTLSATSWQP